MYNTAKKDKYRVFGCKFQFYFFRGSACAYSVRHIRSHKKKVFFSSHGLQRAFFQDLPQKPCFFSSDLYFE